MRSAGVEHQTEGSAAVDEYWRPNASDLVAPRGGDVSRLAGFDQDLSQRIRGVGNCRCARRLQLGRIERVGYPAGAQEQCRESCCAADGRLTCHLNSLRPESSTPTKTKPLWR